MNKMPRMWIKLFVVLIMFCLNAPVIQVVAAADAVNDAANVGNDSGSSSYSWGGLKKAAMGGVSKTAAAARSLTGRDEDTGKPQATTKTVELLV
ncbi:MAG: hypothetical protein HQL69_10350 [Magnetococcales bacterium]|nr:hypothetical protein [Magnetococcales bacterium]